MICKVVPVIVGDPAPRQGIGIDSAVRPQPFKEIGGDPVFQQIIQVGSLNEASLRGVLHPVYRRQIAVVYSHCRRYGRDFGQGDFQHDEADGDLPRTVPSRQSQLARCIRRPGYPGERGL